MCPFLDHLKIKNNKLVQTIIIQKVKETGKVYFSVCVKSNKCNTWGSTSKTVLLTNSLLETKAKERKSPVSNYQDKDVTWHCFFVLTKIRSF